MNKKRWMMLFGGGIVVLLILAWMGFGDRGGIDEEMEAFIGGGVSLSYTDQDPGFENLNDLHKGCPFKDCVPSIDKPEFVKSEEAKGWYADEEKVLSIDYRGTQKAYPVKILNWHEIVNDEAGGDKIVITYSALCGSAGGYKSGELTFGASGRLKNNCTVMYDKEGEGLWDQVKGEAIVGERLGEELPKILVNVTTWKEWKDTYPDGTVLSVNTGFDRDYGTHPYGTYETDKSIYFPLTSEFNMAIHPKTVVYGVKVGEESKAYTLEAIKRETAWDSIHLDQVGGARIRLSYSRGEVFVENLSTKDELVPFRAFWFAWNSYYPRSILIE